MARGRAPFVAVRTDIRKEERVRFIADHAGYNEDEAIGKLIRMWSWCTDRGLEDAPDDCEGYAVPEAVVRRFLGARGVEAILGDGCDELAMGALRPDGLVYLRGTAETVRRIRSLRSSASAGGKARVANGWRAAGRFVSSTTDDQPPADQPPAGEVSAGSQSLQPSTSRPPAATSEIPDPRSLSGDHPHARAIPTSLAERTAVREQLRAKLQAARTRAAAARKVEIKPLLAFDRGVDVDLTDRIARATTPAALQLIADQGQHAIAMAELEVTHGHKSFEWFTGAIFSGGNFSRLVGKTPDDVKRAAVADTTKATLDRARAVKAEPTSAPRLVFVEPPAKVTEEQRAEAARIAREAMENLFGSARAPPRSAEPATTNTDDEQPENEAEA